MKRIQKMYSNALVLVVLALAAIVRAQSTTQLFVPNIYAENLAWSASVIGACPDSTTYALRCSGTPIQPGLPKSIGAVYTSQVNAFCDPNGPAQTVTEGPSGFYQTAELVAINGTTVTGTVSCDLAGTTQAVCSGTLAADWNTHSTTAVGALTMTGAQVPFIDVTITGGSEKIARATGNVCISGGAGLSVSLGFTAAVFVFGIGVVFGL